MASFYTFSWKVSQKHLENLQETFLLEFVLVKVENLDCRHATLEEYTCIYVCS